MSRIQACSRKAPGRPGRSTLRSRRVGSRGRSSGNGVELDERGRHRSGVFPQGEDDSHRNAENGERVIIIGKTLDLFGNPLDSRNNQFCDDFGSIMPN